MSPFGHRAGKGARDGRGEDLDPLVIPPGGDRGGGLELPVPDGEPGVCPAGVREGRGEGHQPLRGRGVEGVWGVRMAADRHPSGALENAARPDHSSCAISGRVV